VNCSRQVSWWHHSWHLLVTGRRTRKRTSQTMRTREMLWTTTLFKFECFVSLPSNPPIIISPFTFHPIESKGLCLHKMLFWASKNRIIFFFFFIFRFLPSKHIAWAWVFVGFEKMRSFCACLTMILHVRDTPSHLFLCIQHVSFFKTNNSLFLLTCRL
jgi:hypothetical protein